MALQLVWSEDAVADLAEIRAFVALERPESAAALSRRILDAVVMLADYPFLGRPGRVTGTRELVVPDTPYLVAYRVVAGSVELLRVLHGARKWPTSMR